MQGRPCRRAHARRHKDFSVRSLRSLSRNDGGGLPVGNRKPSVIAWRNLKANFHIRVFRHKNKAISPHMRRIYSKKNIFGGFKHYD